MSSLCGIFSDILSENDKCRFLFLKEERIKRFKNADLHIMKMSEHKRINGKKNSSSIKDKRVIISRRNAPKTQPSIYMKAKDMGKTGGSWADIKASKDRVELKMNNISAELAFGTNEICSL